MDSKFLFPVFRSVIMCGWSRPCILPLSCVCVRLSFWRMVAQVEYVRYDISQCIYQLLPAVSKNIMAVSSEDRFHRGLWTKAKLSVTEVPEWGTQKQKAVIQGNTRNEYAMWQVRYDYVSKNYFLKRMVCVRCVHEENSVQASF